LTRRSSIGFDAAGLDVFGALLNGATLCPFDARERGIAALGRFLAEKEISIYHSTPTVFRAFAETLRAGERFRSVRLVVLGGEEVTSGDQDLFAAHFREDAVLVNLYGATEATLAHLHASTGSGRPGGRGQQGKTSVPLGKPVEGIETWLLDREGRRAAKFGEIGIRSRFVALGYWNRPEETAARFLPDPVDPDEGGHRIYRTGDLGRLRADGTLEFVGRRDFLVKLRGQRVETGEVEAALAESGLVSKSVVLAREIEGETVLVAYVVPGSPAPTARELQRAISDRLPDYMVPARFVLLSSIPMTPTGKVDRRALPEPGARDEDADAALAAPRTPAEELVKGVWSQVLRSDRIALRENFFDVGGHSLKLTQVASRLEDLLGAEVPLRELFDHPTIESLAERLETRFPSLSRDKKSVTGPREANHLNT
jgi:acyl-coenzyme A synthetase/AMP-(fatty) acid ligase/acyl carrier protein